MFKDSINITKAREIEKIYSNKTAELSVGTDSCSQWWSFMDGSLIPPSSK